MERESQSEAIVIHPKRENFSQHKKSQKNRRLRYDGQMWDPHWHGDVLREKGQG